MHNDSPPLQRPLLSLFGRHGIPSKRITTSRISFFLSFFPNTCPSCERTSLSHFRLHLIKLVYQHFVFKRKRRAKAGIEGEEEEKGSNSGILLKL
jgi:hypothetical protein